MLRQKVESIERRQQILEDDQDAFVTHKHLDAVLPPLQEMVEEIQRDIKKLLLLVASKK